MKTNLNCGLWKDVAEKIRACHLSLLNDEGIGDEKWVEAFDGLLACVNEERKANKYFAPELTDLTEATGFDYDFADILEEYFDHLEEKENWKQVELSATKLLDNFTFQTKAPSEYKYRIGNALQKQGKNDEAEAFGKKWLEEAPNDYYAAASNVFLLISLGRNKEADELTRKYLGDSLVCDNTNDNFFMAAYRLFELTDDANAKERVMKKIAEYQNR